MERKTSSDWTEQINVPDQTENLLKDLSSDNMNGFQWINEPKEYRFEAGGLTVIAEENSDFFINPIDSVVTASAPLFYKHMSGDFVAIAKVRPDLSQKWNAAALMMIIDDTNWIKFAFEYSDATGPSIVTVTTRATSDDANGAVLNEEKEIWLKMVRKNDIYAMHWSSDGKVYHMARLSAMSHADTVLVGLEAQCPVGEKATHRFENFSVESRSVNDLRIGE